MSSSIIQSLPRLQPDSGVRIPTSLIYGAHSGSSAQLTRPARRNGEWVGIPRYDSSTLQYRQKLMTLGSPRSGFVHSLNRGLKGGSSYPVLTFAIGTAAGVVSGGAGFIFGAAVLGLDLSRRDSDVLARKGDEIWAYEAIGKIYENNWFSADGWVAKHVISYFLYDPYRANGNPEKGWLLHESRTTVVFE